MDFFNSAVTTMSTLVTAHKIIINLLIICFIYKHL